MGEGGCPTTEDRRIRRGVREFGLRVVFNQGPLGALPQRILAGDAQVQPTMTSIALGVAPMVSVTFV